jgi:hypothetical protein
VARRVDNRSAIDGTKVGVRENLGELQKDEVKNAEQKIAMPEIRRGTHAGSLSWTRFPGFGSACLPLFWLLTPVLYEMSWRYLVEIRRSHGY